MDEAPRRAAVRRLVEAPLGGTRNGPGHTGAAGRRVAAKRGGRAGVDGVRIAGLDDDRADSLAGELGVADPRPGLALVGRLVEAGAGDTAAAADVGLTGADVDRLAGHVVRVERDGSRRVDPERTTQVVPIDVVREDVLRAPDAATCGADVRDALVRTRVVDGDRRRAATGDVRVRHVQVGVAEAFERVERLARPREHPLSLDGPGRGRTGSTGAVAAAAAAVHLGNRDHGGRIGTMRVLRGSSAARALERHALIAGQGLLELGEMCGQCGWCLRFSQRRPGCCHPPPRARRKPLLRRRERARQSRLRPASCACVSSTVSSPVRSIPGASCVRNNGGLGQPLRRGFARAGALARRLGSCQPVQRPR